MDLALSPKIAQMGTETQKIFPFPGESHPPGAICSTLVVLVFILLEENLYPLDVFHFANRKILSILHIAKISFNFHTEKNVFLLQ